MNENLAALLALPAHVRSRLERMLAAGLLHAPYTTAAVRSAVGDGAGPDASVVSDALAALDRRGISGPAVALALAAATQAAADAPRTDLVWSGPEAEGLRARDTRRVYDELVAAATASIWISTYVYWDGRHAFRSLADRMAARPDLHVAILLNIGRRHGDVTAEDELVRRFAERFWNRDWPGARRPAVYYDPRSLQPDSVQGVLHAKAIVVDEHVALVTSANLTEAAFDRNIEVGILSREAQLAGSLVRHFRVLIDRGLLSPLPRI